MYAQARYYMPEVGRFISEDAYKGTVAEPQSLNWYVYCRNNPLVYYDPTGYWRYKTEGYYFYAVAEKGDTLSGLAYERYGDASAWGIFGYPDDPKNLQIGDKIRITASMDIMMNDPNYLKVQEKGIQQGKPNEPLNSVKATTDVPPSSSGYEAPKKGPKWNKEKRGWEDRYGNVWVPDKSVHGGKHWDVQYPNGGYDNIYEDGAIREGKGGRGRFSPPKIVEQQNCSRENSVSTAEVGGTIIAVIVVGKVFKSIIGGLVAGPPGAVVGASI